MGILTQVGKVPATCSSQQLQQLSLQVTFQFQAPWLPTTDLARAETEALCPAALNEPTILSTMFCRKREGGGGRGGDTNLAIHHTNDTNNSHDIVFDSLHIFQCIHSTLKEA